MNTKHDIGKGEVSRHLTRAPGEYSIDDVHPGMASFVGTGPAGKTCGDCVHRGYHRTIVAQNNQSTRTVKTNACAEFNRLTGKHGPVVKDYWPACKYFGALR
jgi:hypothetical protein